MSDWLQQARRRALQYWAEDGLPDLYTGALLLLFVGLQAGGERLFPAAWRGAEQGVALVVLVLGTLLARPVLRVLKQRITYPRTGYVAYRTPSLAEQRQGLFFTVGLAVVLLALAVLTPDWPTPAALWLTHGVFFAITAALAARLGLPRYWGYAALLLLAAGFYTLTWETWPTAWHDALAAGLPTLALLGLVMLLSGAWTLARYLQRYPVWSGEAES